MHVELGCSLLEHVICNSKNVLWPCEVPNWKLPATEFDLLWRNAQLSDLMIENVPHCQLSLNYAKYHSMMVPFGR